MKLRFTPRALRDLTDIAEFLRAESPAGATSVRSAIFESLQLLKDVPRIGRAQSVDGVRKLVTRRYGYLVYYVIDEANDGLAVLTIQHPARERPFAER
jgi:plasmid stabilization system protein ParE